MLMKLCRQRLSQIVARTYPIMYCGLGVYICMYIFIVMHGLSREQSKSQHAHYTECIISPPCTATSVAGEKADIPCILTVAKEILTSLQAK